MHDLLLLTVNVELQVVPCLRVIDECRVGELSLKSAVGITLSPAVKRDAHPRGQPVDSPGLSVVYPTDVGCKCSHCSHLSSQLTLAKACDILACVGTFFAIPQRSGDDDVLAAQVPAAIGGNLAFCAGAFCPQHPVVALHNHFAAANSIATPSDQSPADRVGGSLKDSDPHARPHVSPRVAGDGCHARHCHQLPSPASLVPISVPSRTGNPLT